MSRFEVGQRVSLTANGSDIPHPRIVEAVSASGRVNLAGDARSFNPNGALRGRAGWDATHIEPWSDHHAARRAARFEIEMRSALLARVFGDATDTELTTALAAALAARKPGAAS